MTEGQQQALHTEKVVAEYFVIETHILSTRSADAYKAIDRSRNSPVCLWMLRHPLEMNSDAVRRFLDRMYQIDQIDPPLADTSAYGVDAEGTAFSLFPPLDGYSIISGNIEAHEAERRFISALRHVQRLHDVGIVCGDLCGSSFWVNREGELRFLGIMGSFDTEAAATAMAPPLDTIPFLAPEQRGGGGVEPMTDVFALGVLGYYLLTKKYPYGEGMTLLGAQLEASQIPPISSECRVPPVWAEEVLRKCLSPRPEERYRNAGEVLSQISEIRQRVFSEESTPVAKKSSAPAAPKEEKPRQKLESFATPPRSASASMPVVQPEEVVTKSRKTLFLGGFVIVLLLLFLLPGLFRTEGREEMTNNLREELQPHIEALSDSNLRDAIDVISEGDKALSEREKRLTQLANSDDPIAHDVLVTSAHEANSQRMRELSEKAIVKRARRLGLLRSAEQLHQWLRTLRPGQFPSSYESMLKAVDRSLPEEARFALLRQSYASDPRVALRLTVALALDLDKLGEFQSVISQLVGDSLHMTGLKKYSSLSLILAHPDLALVFGEDIVQKRNLIPDQDILWLLRILADRNDINVRAIANVAVEREILPKVRQVFLSLIRDRGDLPVDVMGALIRAAAGSLTKDDLSAFGRWYDIRAEEVLLAILADVEDIDLLREAFDILAGKSMTIEPSATMVAWIREGHWSERENFAKVVGVMGNLEKMREKEIEAAFDAFSNAAQNSDLLDMLLDTDHPVVVRMVVSQYSDLLGLGTLLSLLSNRDAEVRKQAVRGLKSFNDIAALKLIIDRYEKEKDESVREVYRETFWVIRQREEGSNPEMNL